jgi:hypothetical protein
MLHEKSGECQIPLACFGMVVLLVTTSKIHFKEQVPVAGTKQRRQADKAVGPSSFVLCLLLIFQVDFL